MSLMAAFNEATKGWDPKKDSTQMSSNLPAGDYNVIVEKVDHPVYKSGWDCLRFTMLVSMANMPAAKNLFKSAWRKRRRMAHHYLTLSLLKIFGMSLKLRKWSV